VTAALTVLTVFPEQSNVNGDAENALVLAQRARWAGHSAEILRLAMGGALRAGRPDIVVIGSTTDVAVAASIAALRPHRTALADWMAAGVPVLAIGTGWEILGESVALESGVIDGLGLLPGRAVVASARVSDDLVVDSRFGRLVGYENHARDYLAGDSPGASGEVLGSVVYGRGNGAGAASEGLVVGNTIATHLHGPVLAKNPAIADHLLTLVLGERYDSRTVPAGRVDDLARAARNAIATRLGLDGE
jgi:CobQ-like glutamine amidotransferase family enzyme